MATLKRIPSLDGLRAISIALVLCGHLYGTANYPRDAATHLLGSYAHFGVQVFFVISGFLITTLLMKEHAKTGQINLLAFYRRRTVRIFPACFFYILVVVLLSAPFAHRYLWSAVTYTMCYAGQGRPWILGHLWSLSVEEQFYLLWPFAFALVFSLRKQVAWAVVLLAPLARFLCWHFGMHDIDEYFPAVADSIAAGCLLALYRERLTPLLPKLTNPFIGLPIVAAALLSPMLLYRVSIQIALGGLVPFLIAACILIAVEGEYRFLNNPAASFVGVMSYSLYLWQQPFLNRTAHHRWTGFPVNVALAFLCAYLSYRVIERPAMRFRL